MKKIAIFVAGDENIYFPGLVTLSSVDKSNPGVFDLYMCFDERKLDNVMRKGLLSNNIKFIDSRSLDRFGVRDNFKMMREEKWPIDVFYNYVLPIYLGEIGYEFSIKIDYDIICIDSYELAEILPHEKVLGGLCSSVNLKNDGLSDEHLKFLINSNYLKSTPNDYMNVGFLIFNNKKYTEMRCYEYFSKAYSMLYDLNKEMKLLEQMAFSLLLFKIQDEYLKISDSYNHRILWTRNVDENLNFDTKNIHYITEFKPWRKLRLDKLKWFINRGNGALYFYWNFWHKFAEDIQGYKIFCAERKLSEKQMLGLEMFVVKKYNEKIKELQSELIKLKK